MRWQWILTSCVSFSFLHARENTFSETRIQSFYDTFFCEEKADLALMDLDSICSYTPPTPTSPTSPPSPTAPIPTRGTGVYVSLDNAALPYLVTTINAQGQTGSTLGVDHYPTALLIGGTGLYVSNYSSNNVNIIDLSKWKVVGTVGVGTNPRGLALAGTGLYVANYGSSNLSIIDIAKQQQVGSVTVDSFPMSELIAGTSLYVTAQGPGKVDVVDLSRLEKVGSMTVGDHPVQMALAGTALYVANQGATSVSIVDLSLGREVSRVTVGTAPYALAVVGTKLYVSNSGANTVNVMDMPTHTISGTVTVGGDPLSLAPVGTGLFVACYSSSNVNIIDTSTNQVSGTVALGHGPLALASGSLYSAAPLPPVPPPPAPPECAGYLPVRIVNNTGIPDDQIYLCIKGHAATACLDKYSSYVFVEIPASPAAGGTYSPVPTGHDLPHPSSYYSYPLSSITGDANGHYFYLPFLESGRFYYSIGTAATLPVNAGSIGDPVGVDPLEASYNVLFDKTEVNWKPANCPPAKPTNQFSWNQTAVDFFAMPVYIYLSAGAASKGQGCYQTRKNILQNLTATLNTAKGAALTEWRKLEITGSTGMVMRVLSPGYSMDKGVETPINTRFDRQYLDNAAAYGYSWAQDVWAAATSYYAQVGHTLTIKLDSGVRYTGGVQNVGGQYYFVLKGELGGQVYGIPWDTSLTPSTTPPSMSQALFNPAALLPGVMKGNPGSWVPATDADAVAVELCQVLEGTIMLSLMPADSSVEFSKTYIQNSLANFYQISSKLSSAGQNSGPWFDLYDEGIHNPLTMENKTYAYPWDDIFYPSLSLGAGFATYQNGYYLGIILSPFE